MDDQSFAVRMTVYGRHRSEMFKPLAAEA